MAPLTHTQVPLRLSLAVLLMGLTVGCGSSPGSTGKTGGASGATGGTPGSTGGSGGAPSASGGGPGNGTGGATGSGGAALGSGGARTGGAGPATGGAGGPASGGAAGGRGGGAGGASSGGAAGGATASGGAAGAGTACLMFGAPTTVGTIEATALNGPSGMVASRAHPGVLWAQMDTGGPATVFAMTLAGKSLGEFALMGVTQNDWEDIAVGKGPEAGSYIYVADIGDNSSNRTAIQVYRLPEPEVTVTQAAVKMNVTADVLRFTYPDGAHNAETLMIDPQSGDILILTKVSSGASTLYRAPNNTPVDTPTVLEKVTTVTLTGGSMGAGGGDISPNGDRVIIRVYTTTLLWARAATWAATFMATPKVLTDPSPEEPQAEGVSFSADGRSWITTGEQARSIYQAMATCP